jgi:hypothetical protein
MGSGHADEIGGGGSEGLSRGRGGSGWRPRRHPARRCRRHCPRRKHQRRLARGRLFRAATGRCRRAPGQRSDASRAPPSPDAGPRRAPAPCDRLHCRATERLERWPGDDQPERRRELQESIGRGHGAASAVPVGHGGPRVRNRRGSAIRPLPASARRQPRAGSRRSRRGCAGRSGRRTESSAPIPRRWRCCAR